MTEEDGSRFLSTRVHPAPFYILMLLLLDVVPTKKRQKQNKTTNQPNKHT